jgi:hypothetical protein
MIAAPMSYLMAFVDGGTGLISILRRIGADHGGLTS